MQNILIGNGLIIQFGGIDYLNNSIIKRSFSLLKDKNFPEVAMPRSIGEWVKGLNSILPEIYNGGLNEHTLLSGEPELLNEIKLRYNSDSKVEEIGLEDYFFLNHLFCRKHKIKGWERKEIYLKRFFLHGIYNKGKINKVHLKFPEKLKLFLNQYENIFTTNYDINLEFFLKKKINYLHGAFHILDDPYDPNSLRNKLFDAPLKAAPEILGYEYLFSNCVAHYLGSIKKSKSGGGLTANDGLKKILKKYNADPKYKATIDNMKNDKLSFGRKLYEAIMLMKKDQQIGYNENHSLVNLQNVEGSLSILGLSPYNDFHLFRLLNENNKIGKIIYYYFTSVALRKKSSLQ